MRKIIPLSLFVALVTVACSSIDCPLNNTVYSKYLVQGPNKITSDTLTVYTTRQNGQDTILLNKSVKTDSFSLPMSYVRDTDVLYFQLTDTLNQTVKDTIRITKSNLAHFESVDCALSYFHTITAVSHTHHALDSVVLVNPSVTYDSSKAHFHIHFKSRN